MKNNWKNPISHLRSILENRPILKGIIHNTGWLITDKAMRLALGLFVSAWVARYLGPSKYGELAFVISFVAIFQAFSTLGLDNIVVQKISTSIDRSNEILGAALGMRILSGLASFVFANLAACIFYPENIEIRMLILIIGTGILFQSTDVIDLWFQSQGQNKKTILSKGFGYAIGAGLKIALILNKAPLFLFASAMSLELAISALALYTTYRKYPTKKKWLWKSSITKEMLKRSFPLLVAAVSVILYMKSSQLIIHSLLSNESVGVFAPAQMLSEIWYFIPVAIVTSVAPAIARKKILSEIEYEKSLQILFSIMWIISILIALIVCIFSQYIINIILGESYKGSAIILSIYIFTLVPVCIGLAQSLWFINENKQYLLLYQSLSSAMISVVLNILLIAKYGIIGGVIAILLTQLIQTFIIGSILSPRLFILKIESLFLIIKYIRRKTHLPNDFSKT